MKRVKLAADQQDKIDELTKANNDLKRQLTILQKANNQVEKDHPLEEKIAVSNSSGDELGLCYSHPWQQVKKADVFIFKMSRDDIISPDRACSVKAHLKLLLPQSEIDRLFDEIMDVYDHNRSITRELESLEGKWLMVNIDPYVFNLSSDTGSIVTFFNIDHLKNSQLELTNTNAKLLRINEDLESFVYAASHDLLGPLGNIEASLSGIQQRSNENDFNTYLQIIDVSIKKFRGLILNLATIAKIENGMAEPEWVNLNELITNITWSIQDKLLATNAIIETVLEIEEIRFAKKNLHSILYNLISNAIKFKGEQAPLITITTRKVDKNIILTVGDNGKGIQNNAMDKIFKAYGRLNQNIEGSGVGLYLIRKLINSAGGQISVESREGIGSDFILSFPDDQ